VLLNISWKNRENEDACSDTNGIDELWTAEIEKTLWNPGL